MPEAKDKASIIIKNEGGNVMEQGFKKSRGNINVAGMSNAELVKVLQYTGHGISYYEDGVFKNIHTFGIADDSTRKIEAEKKFIKETSAKVSAAKVRREQEMANYKLNKVEGLTVLIDNHLLNIKKAEDKIKLLESQLPEVNRKKIAELESLITKCNQAIIEPAKEMIQGLKKTVK